MDFLKKLGIKDIGKIVERMPQVLEYDIESMQACVDLLRKLGIKDIGKIVGLLPRLLGFSAEHMQRNVQYLTGNVHLTIKDLESTPALLCLSLDEITARWEYLKKKAPTDYMRLKKGRLFCITDSEYIELVRSISADARLDDYASFALSVKSKAEVRT